MRQINAFLGKGIKVLEARWDYRAHPAINLALAMGRIRCREMDGVSKRVHVSVLKGLEAWVAKNKKRLDAKSRPRNVTMEKLRRLGRRRPPRWRGGNHERAIRSSDE